MQIEQPTTSHRNAREATRREILEVLTESGFAPAQGVEGLMDRLLGGQEK